MSGIGQNQVILLQTQKYEGVKSPRKINLKIYSVSRFHEDRRHLLLFYCFG